MRVLVTGGAGFIGSNLCAELVERGVAVRALDNLSTGLPANLDGLDLELVEGSITDADLMIRVAADVDAVVHLAARPSVPRSIADPVACHEVNTDGTFRVLEAARAHDLPVVAASSSSVYGGNPTIPKHERLAPMPLSPYAASKLANEALALSYQHVYGLPVLMFRFFNVYGPRQRADHAYAAVVPKFIDAALAGRPLEVHGDGRQSRDFTFVRTVVRVLAEAATNRVHHETAVNLAYGSRTDLLDLIGRVERLVGHPVEVRHTDSRPGDVRHTQADNTVLRGLFPAIEPESLEDGLQETVRWFRSTTGHGPS
jgi:UDP-glucose 4-epimerase